MVVSRNREGKFLVARCRCTYLQTPGGVPEYKHTDLILLQKYFHLSITSVYGLTYIWHPHPSGFGDSLHPRSPHCEVNHSGQLHSCFQRAQEVWTWDSTQVPPQYKEVIPGFFFSKRNFLFPNGIYSEN